MVGNVLEWCRTKWRPNYAGYEQAVDDSLEGDDCARVLRGGSWYNLTGLARCAFRNRSVPDYRDANVGFRVVASPFSEL